MFTKCRGNRHLAYLLCVPRIMPFITNDIELLIFFSSLALSELLKFTKKLRSETWTYICQHAFEFCQRVLSRMCW